MLRHVEPEFFEQPGNRNGVPGGVTIHMPSEGAFLYSLLKTNSQAKRTAVEVPKMFYLFQNTLALTSSQLKS